ncbi:MFS transporter [Amycolatopsis sp. NPDC004625]|uniref:MFS transporter n=1 Tax=Amycolatopsis sp. NPDC004625 TaxID=3154670 RepID=UPI0033AFD128
MIGPEAATSEDAARPARRDRNVMCWLAGLSSTHVGNSVYFFALGWSAQKAGGPIEVAMLMTAGLLPRVLLMLVGGVVADLVDPRRLVLASDGLRCVLVLVLAADYMWSAPVWWILVTVAVGFGVVDAVYVPALGALAPRITSPDQLARVAGLRSVSMRLAQICGPLSGGAAMGLGGPGVAFTLASLLFALSLPFLFATQLRAGETDGASGQSLLSLRASVEDMLDGLRYIRRHRLIGRLIVTSAVGEFGLASILNVGWVFLDVERGWGPSGYGWMGGSFSAAAALSASLLAVAGRVPCPGILLSVAMLAGCAGAAAITLASTLRLAMVMAAVMGLAAGVFGTVDNVLLQVVTDRAYLGRVTSFAMLAVVGLAPLGYPIVGTAIEVWGPAPTIAAFSGFMGGGAVIAFLSRAVRRAELPR